MKINVEVEVSPVEARTFLGLPDVRPLQDEVLNKMKEKMVNRMDNFDAMLYDPTKVMESYFSLYPQWMEAFKKFGSG